MAFLRFPTGSPSWSDLHIYKDLYGKNNDCFCNLSKCGDLKKSSYLTLAECFFPPVWSLSRSTAIGRLCSKTVKLQRSNVSLVTCPETQITSTPGGRQSLAPFLFWNLTGAKDCLPPGVEVIWGQIAKLTFDHWSFTVFEQSLPTA